MKFLGVLLMAVAASADLYSNGQYFGSGIVIVDAPAPNSTFQVNATMPIAIDISLDGKPFGVLFYFFLIWNEYK